MPQHQIREAVGIKVTQSRGFVVEIHQKDLCVPLYRVLHLSSTGNRLSEWFPETELSPLEPGELPPFPNPFETTTLSE